MIDASREARTHPPYRPSPLELACGWVFGTTGDSFTEVRHRRRQARGVFEELLRVHLRRGNCFVAFSGGRDSSALLATAVQVARRDGLPLPIPVTQCFDDPAAHEHSWQQLVIRHLKLNDWLRLRADADYDLLGPVASTVLSRYGVLWPALLYTNLPLLEEAKGGTLLTGEGGDQLFGPRRSTPVRHLVTGTASQRLHALMPARRSLGPRGWRRRQWKRRQLLPPPWLTPPARAVVTKHVVEDLVDEPLQWPAAARIERCKRSWRHAESNLGMLAASCGARIDHPLLDRRFVYALAHEFGRLGPMTRTDAMERLFGDALPTAMIARSSKAQFNAAVIGPRSRQFAVDWDGTGVDDNLVEAEKLRDIWLSDRPHSASFALLQSAWLSGRS